MTRQEIANMSDVGLCLRYEATANKLAADWRRGAPGRLVDVYDVALMRLEADIRSMALAPVSLPNQGKLF